MNTSFQRRKQKLRAQVAAGAPFSNRRGRTHKHPPAAGRRSPRVSGKRTLVTPKTRVLITTESARSRFLQTRENTILGKEDARQAEAIRPNGLKGFKKPKGRIPPAFAPLQGKGMRALAL